MGNADVDEISVILPAEADVEDNNTMMIHDSIIAQKIEKDDIGVYETIFLRLKNSDTTFQVRLKSFDDIREDFYTNFKKRYGFKISDDPIHIDSIAVEVFQSKNNEIRDEINQKRHKVFFKKDYYSDQIFIDGKWQKCKLVQKKDLYLNEKVTGPAIVIDEFTSILVRPNWQCEKLEHDDVILKSTIEKKYKIKNIETSKPNPMLLEVFNNIFMSIAEQMGIVLENTAQSVTIKERLDFSCAVFDKKGDLIANAPHMPVHLGSMDASVKAIILKNKIIKKGDVYALNAPYHGGTHLQELGTVC